MKKNVKKVTLIGILLILSLALSGCHRGIHRMMERMHGERFGEMREFGQDMMPFGRGMRGSAGNGREMMAGVTHVFDKTDDGGIYQMVAEDADDAETIAMIQERLSSMAERAGIENAVAPDAEEADSEETDAEEADGEDADAEETDGEEVDGEDAEHHQERERQGNGMDRREKRGMDLFGSRMGGFGEFMDDITIAYGELDDGGQITISSDNPEAVELIHTWIESGPMSRGERGGNGHR